MHELTAWIVSAMLAWVPARPNETPRYVSIASDIASVAAEAPVFPNEEGVARTALLMAAIASFESSFRDDVDSFQTKGDHGRSVGLMQVQLRKGEECGDRIACLRIGRERIRESLQACKSLPFSDRLSVYTMGRCSLNSASRWRIARATEYWKRSPFQAP